MRGEEIKISVKVQGEREVRKFSMKHYLPRHKSFSSFFEDLKAEFSTILNELIRR